MMDGKCADFNMCSVEILSNQVRVLRQELKNIREKQKQLQVVMNKAVYEIRSRLDLGTEQPPSLCAVKTSANSKTFSGETYDFKPISFIKSCYKSKNGTPRQAVLGSTSRASLTLDRNVFNNPDHSLSGLEEFSHVWLLFVFHENGNAENATKAKVRAPRMDGTTAGVFATRSPHRPCPIGLSLTKLDSIEGDTLYLSGVDLIDGTPVLDIKPYIPSYDSPDNRTVASTSFSASHTDDRVLNNARQTTEVSSGSKDSSVRIASWIKTPTVSVLEVLFTERAEKQLTLFHHHSSHKEKCQWCLEFLKDASEMKSAIIDVLRHDPRSVYRRNKCTDRLYYFTLDAVHATCWFDEFVPVVEVLRLRPDTKNLPG